MANHSEQHFHRPPAHVIPVMVPIEGADGILFTVSKNVATAERHGVPRGLSVVAVIVTILSLSPAEGV